IEIQKWPRGELQLEYHGLGIISCFNHPDYPARRKTRRTVAWSRTNPEGAENDKSLVIRGWQRAGAWAALFGTELGGEQYPKPNMIYAANPDTSPIEEPSHRPFQTVIPLCKRLDLPPIVDFQVGQERELASAIVDCSGVVLISWEHKAITNQLLPSIAGG
ncbi:MAG TPA: hypothetical protein VHY59_00310, partial [Chthoniobacterales bacterium]|nr:hypothetical protein [Chthoniobacterales bacterium]